ncbi:MAG TPA: phosphatase PAP2 family protein [Opitutaceae bacterium]|nr:phosphatase PAP2 family protein [Opitutaceae bacterium]
MQSRTYLFVDYATQFYLGLVGLAVLCLHGRAVPSWPLLLVGHAVAIGLIHALIRGHAARPGRRVLDFLRHFYPMLLYGPFYWETGILNHMLAPGFLDPFFIRLEARLFGVQPGLAFMDWLPLLPVSELFYAAYFSFYLMIAGVALALFLRKRSQFLHFVSVISLVFYVCYFIFIFVPIVGPLIFFREIPGYRLPADVQLAAAPVFPAAVQAGLWYRIMLWVYRPFEAPGASFPSSHVAVAIGTAYFSFLYLRRIRWPHLVAVILLCASTVYCRYHYAVDVVAGGLVAAVLIPLGSRLHFKVGNAGTPRAPHESEVRSPPA